MPDAYGLTMVAYRSTLPWLYEHAERVVGRFGDYQEPGVPVVE
jgi:hypothetical protein